MNAEEAKVALEKARAIPIEHRFVARLKISRRAEKASMSDKDALVQFADSVDQIISLGVYPTARVRREIYSIARHRHDEPLCLKTTEGLVKNVERGSNVIFCTGAVTLKPLIMPKGETCGALGTASLARALNLGLKAKPIVLCEPVLVEGVKVACEAAGFTALTWEEFEECSSGVFVKGFPLNETEARKEADKILAEMNPRAIIACTKHGANSRGQYHTENGINTTPSRMKTSILFERAKEKRIFTVGLAEGVNKIGVTGDPELLGKIKEVLPNKGRCGCSPESPCGGAGWISTTPCDAFVFSGVSSNPAAWGVEACLAAMFKDMNLLHDGETERRILHMSVDIGQMIDAGTGRRVYGVDGFPEAANIGLLEVLRASTQKYVNSMT